MRNTFQDNHNSAERQEHMRASEAQADLLTRTPIKERAVGETFVALNLVGRLLSFVEAHAKLSADLS